MKIIATIFGPTPILRPFDDDEIYEFESKKYCEQDYKLLYAPQCASCGDFVFGEVIKVSNRSYI